MGYPNKSGNDEFFRGTEPLFKNSSRPHARNYLYPSRNSCVSIVTFKRLDPFEAKEECLGGIMRRDLALTGAARQMERPARSIACLAFVAVLGAAFWVGAAWIVDTVLRLHGPGL